MIQEAAERTGDAVEDGTSTSTLLAHAMLADGIRNIAAGATFGISICPMTPGSITVGLRGGVEIFGAAGVAGD